MRITLGVIGLFASLPMATVGGINWNAVWLAPQRDSIVLTVAESQSYTVMGLSGAGTKADLTSSKELKITSSDPSVLEIDRDHGLFVAKKPGHVDIDIAFSEARERVPAFVRPPKTAADAPTDGVWKAVFTGDSGAQPKMVSEIFFDVTAHGNSLTGTVHAAYWPGDAPISDGVIDGNRVSFAMVGSSPSWAYGSAGRTESYPKLCFQGVRDGDAMKIGLFWTGAQHSCKGGPVMPMAGRKLAE